LWFLYEDDYDDIVLLEANYNLAMAEIKRQIAENSIDTIIGEMWADGWAYKDIDEWYDFLHRVETQSRKLGIKHFYLGVGQCHDYQEKLNDKGLSYRILDYHWAVQEVQNNNKQNILPWNSNTGKFLFLGGAPARPKRIGMLSKFYDEGMLSNAEWSFYPPWTPEDKTWCRNYLGHYTDYKYKKFLKDCTREIDPYYKQIAEYSRMSGKELADKQVFQQHWWKTVGYIDNTVFQNTSLSIVNEGPGNDTRFLTEKLWQTVFNNHPFILVDNPERFQYCKDIGLRMFEDYVAIKDYGYIENPEQQMIAVVENTKYFLNNLPAFADRVKKDIEHNRQVYFSLVEHNTQLKDFMQKILAKTDIHKYLSTEYLGSYNRIPRLCDIPKHKDI
jgi:hypothetical protein